MYLARKNQDKPTQFLMCELFAKESEDRSKKKLKLLNTLLSHHTLQIIIIYINNIILSSSRRCCPLHIDFTLSIPSFTLYLLSILYTPLSHILHYFTTLLHNEETSFASSVSGSHLQCHIRYSE